MASGTKSKRRTASTKRGSQKRDNGSLGNAMAGVMTTVKKFLTGDISVEFRSLYDLFVKELKDLYGAEHQLLDALPKMAEESNSTQLKKAFQAHRRETIEQVRRLELVFTELGLTPEVKKCKAMEGLIAEGDEWIEKSADPGVKDAGLIAAAQRVEHYEMAGYGCVRTYARLLNRPKIVKLLQTTLDEEGAADKKLTALAKRINVKAEHAAKRGKHRNPR